MFINTNNSYYGSSYINKSSSGAKNIVFPTIQLESLPKAEDGKKPLFAVFSEGGSMAVYKTNNHNENEARYIVKGISNGTEYEEEVSINDIKTNEASIIEVAALQVHLVETKKISKVDLGAFTRCEDGQFIKRSFFDKVDYLSLFQDMFDNNLNQGNYRVTQYLDKILYELGKYRG